MTIPGSETLKKLLEEGGPAPWMASLIDHTFLKPDGKEEDIKKLCREARENGFFAVCVYPRFVGLCREELAGSPVKVATVVGFPSGTVATAEKVSETSAAVGAGADEIDMVLNVDWLKKRRLRELYQDVRSVVEAAGPKLVKVILETSLLDQEEKVMAASVAKAAGARFLKTSTGFSSGGATAEDVALLRRVAAQDIGVKASGGVRSRSDALRMVLAGANRIGTSSGVAILSGESSRGGGY